MVIDGYKKCIKILLQEIDILTIIYVKSMHIEGHKNYMLVYYFSCYAALFVLQ